MSETHAVLRERIHSIDLLRGLVMLLMALDHVRDFFGPTADSPEAMDDPGLALFLTRWITHFCAPTFVFLSGVSAWLYSRNTGASQAELQKFLWTRGLWLIVVEFLLVNPSWPYILDGVIFVQVIWAIGWSMIFLALLLPLGPRVIATIGLLMIFGMSLTDGLDSASMGSLGVLWQFLHVKSGFLFGDGWFFFIGYPLLPWVGIMFVGYGFGQLVTERSDGGWFRVATMAGVAATVLYILLRATNLYGNPVDWDASGSFSDALISFLNVEKYPPSLQFTLMTLGPALLLMPWLEGLRGRIVDIISVFGRVPFFYYVLHVPLMYLLAIVYSYARYGEAFWWMRGPDAYPEGYALNLWLVYGAWLLVVTLLYPASRWYADLKRRRKDLRWLSYL